MNPKSEPAVGIIQYIGPVNDSEDSILFGVELLVTRAQIYIFLKGVV
jgi:hypothetical protein